MRHRLLGTLFHHISDGASLPNVCFFHFQRTELPRSIPKGVVNLPEPKVEQFVAFFFRALLGIFFHQPRAARPTG